MKLKPTAQQVTLQKQSPEIVCKKSVLRISQNSLENTCARDSFDERNSPFQIPGLTLLVDEYWTDRMNSSSCKKTNIWKLIHQVAKIIKQPEAESRLSKQLLDNFQTEN